MSKQIKKKRLRGIERIDINRVYRLEEHMEDDFVMIAKMNSCYCFKGEDDLPGNHWPDELILLPGPNPKYIWIEFKLPYNDVQPGQKIRIQELKRAGHEVFVFKTIKSALQLLAKKLNKRI